MGRSAAFALHPSQKSAEDTGCELVSDCSCTKSVVTAQSGILGAGRAAVVVAVRARRATRIEAECLALARAGVVGGRTGGRGGAKRQVECRRPCWVEKVFLGNLTVKFHVSSTPRLLRATCLLPAQGT